MSHTDDDDDTECIDPKFSLVPDVLENIAIYLNSSGLEVVTVTSFSGSMYLDTAHLSRSMNKYLQEQNERIHNLQGEEYEVKFSDLYTLVHECETLIELINRHAEIMDFRKVLTLAKEKYGETKNIVRRNELDEMLFLEFTHDLNDFITQFYS